MSLKFGLEGPYTVMHHQYYQMVDLLTQHCRQTMGGLNPYALPYVPSKNGTKESVCKPKNNKQNVEPSKWHTCKKKKGNRKKNINKNNKVKETKIVGNRFSRLQEMVKDCPEVTEVLKKVVEEEKPQNENKDENDIKKYEVESVEIQTLDEEIRKYKEHDQKIEHNMNLNENIDDDSNKTDDESEEEQNAWCKEIDYDSEEERNAWRLLHPDEESDSDCSTSYESDEEEDEEELFKRKIKWRERSNSA